MGNEPKDYDFFILFAYDLDKFEDIKKSIKEKLTDLEIIVSKVEWHKSEPYLAATVKYKDVEIQILVNPATNINELLDTFDWNVCLFALGKEGIVWKEDINNIGVGKELKLNKVTFPFSTLRRGFRFSERFLMKLIKNDVIKLCEMIIENSKKGNEIGPKGNEPDMKSLEKNLLVK